MALLKLKPAYKEAIWGGRKLIEKFGKDYDGDNLAESWELSAHPDGESVISSGKDKGLTLREYIEKYGKGVLGKNCERFDDFPILIKFIDAKGDLSVQVHPDDEYALKHEGQYGKTELWYVLDAEPGSMLCYGVNRTVDKDTFRGHIENETLDELMNMVSVKKGDVFFIKPGTLHAIGGGIVVAEIQQNSNVTYRVYDYGRKGADGKPRELHIDKALDVIRLEPPRADYDFGKHIGKCDAFIVDDIRLDGEYNDIATDKSFVSLLVADGEVDISCDNESVHGKRGDSILITAGSGEYKISGRADILKTTIPDM